VQHSPVQALGFLHYGAAGNTLSARRAQSRHVEGNQRRRSGHRSRICSRRVSALRLSTSTALRRCVRARCPAHQEGASRNHARPHSTRRKQERRSTKYLHPSTSRLSSRPSSALPFYRPSSLTGMYYPPRRPFAPCAARAGPLQALHRPTPLFDPQDVASVPARWRCSATTRLFAASTALALFLRVCAPAHPND
jgi:hypothetical protein